VSCSDVQITSDCVVEIFPSIVNHLTLALDS